MPNSGTLSHCDAARCFIDDIADPVTRNLVQMAFVRFVQNIHITRSDAPDADLDMAFVARTLVDFFAEHAVLTRTLEGETVGAWFDSAP